MTISGTIKKIKDTMGWNTVKYFRTSTNACGTYYAIYSDEKECEVIYNSTKGCNKNYRYALLTEDESMHGDWRTFAKEVKHYRENGKLMNANGSGY